MAPLRLQAGNVLIGSDHKLVLQTMTTTNTRDVEATVEQIKKCADAGADMVRLTVQGKSEAEACFKIRERLFQVRARIVRPYVQHNSRPTGMHTL
jgi:(E)-4-hydroxy-3-methylbut-2-enyl-diphosphate synthase